MRWSQSQWVPAHVPASTVCKHHKHSHKHAHGHLSTQEGEIILHWLNLKKQAIILEEAKNKVLKFMKWNFRFDFNEPHPVNLCVDLYRHVCGGSFVLCVSAVIPCHACDRSFPRRLKENGARSRERVCLLLQSQLPGERGAEIVLSVRIKPGLQVLVCC